MSTIKIITGAKQSGKTTFLLNYIEQLKSNKISVAGIIAIGTFKNNIRDSFSIKDISTNEKKLFLSRKYLSESEKIGRFYIDINTYHWGMKILEKAILSDSKYLIIDEIGALELTKKGWYFALSRALKSNKNIVITVRDKFIDDIIDFFNIENYKIINP